MKEFLKYTLATVVGLFITFLFLGLLLFFSVMSLISSSDNKMTQVKDNSVLELNLDYDIPERSNPDISAIFDPENSDRLSGLDRILSCIEDAKKDPKIKGILLKPNISGTGYATVLEIRNALKDFKQSGKFVYSLAPYYDEKTYYMASVADSVFLERSGNVLFNGLTANIMFFKGALEKIGIDMQYVKVGAYKGAVEAFTRTDLSPENRLQISEYINDLYSSVLLGISESRKIDTAKLAAAFNGFVIQTPKQAVSFGLIDRLVYEDEVISMVKSKLKINKEKDLNLVRPSGYSGFESEESEAKDKIAIVYAVGEIIEGKGNQSTIGSESMIKALRNAREDKNVKAIVLRINSPGGSSMASDVIAREIALCKSVKPVVVSMSDVAASGGYYIAALADTIVALPNTITGSIGVFGLFPNMHELLVNKIGLTFESVKTGQYSDFARVDQPLTPTDMMYLQGMVNRIYDDFTNVVEKGRGMDSVTVESLAQGRVWTAVQAKKRGLIDVYGGINEAIKIAAFMSKTKKYSTVAYPKIENPFSQLFRNAGNTMMENRMESELGYMYTYFKAVKSSLNMQGFQTRLPYQLLIQ